MRQYLPTEVLDRWLQSRMLDVHTAIPCKVLAYDSSKQTVDVQPMIKRYVLDTETSERTAESLPPLYGLPVAFPRAGGFHMSLPIAVDDFMLAIFSEEPAQAYHSKAREVEPGLLDRHGLNGAFAFPCGTPITNALSTAPPTDGVVVSSDNGAGSITVKDGEVLLGDNTATDYAALASKVDAFISFVDTVFGWAPTPNDGGAALKLFYASTKTASYPTGFGTVAASKTKVK